MKNKFDISGAPRDHRIGLVVLEGKCNPAQLLKDTGAKVLWVADGEDDTYALVAHPDFSPVEVGEDVPTYQCLFSMEDGKLAVHFFLDEDDINDED